MIFQKKFIGRHLEVSVKRKLARRPSEFGPSKIGPPGQSPPEKMDTSRNPRANMDPP